MHDSIPSGDRDILRGLAGELAEIAALDIHAHKAELWRRMNDLDAVRPMLLVMEIPWHEMNVDDELTLRCTDAWARQQETQLRRTLYQWRHMRGDMVIEPELVSPLAITNTAYGLAEDVDIVRTDENSDVVSRHFKRVITEPDDIEKIQMAVVTHDEAASEDHYRKMCDIYDGILPVRQEGIRRIWYTPWDALIRWWGVQEAMMDLVLRPEMVKAAVQRCAASMNAALDQLEEQNLLAPGFRNNRIGSGGYGYVSDLPADGYDPGNVRAIDNWGCSNAQIFSEVSPEMHWEFAIQFDIPWLQRWGLNYYGCCEPLDLKMDIVRRIPNLRKVSMSPKVRPARAAEAVGGDYVYSAKPNPAIVAENSWRPEQARQELRETLDAAWSNGCHVEVILKDISTAGYQPQRLWEWTTLASELVEEYSR